MANRRYWSYVLNRYVTEDVLKEVEPYSQEFREVECIKDDPKSKVKDFNRQRLTLLADDV